MTEIISAAPGYLAISISDDDTTYKKRPVIAWFRREDRTTWPVVPGITSDTIHDALVLPGGTVFDLQVEELYDSEAAWLDDMREVIGSPDLKAA